MDGAGGWKERGNCATLTVEEDGAAARHSVGIFTDRKRADCTRLRTVGFRIKEPPAFAPAYRLRSLPW